MFLRSRVGIRYSFYAFGLIGFLACRTLPPPAPAPAAPAAAPASTETPGDARKPHAAFAESFFELEKTRVNAFWRCLFGKNGDGRRFNSPEQLNGALESMLFADPRTFPAHVSQECVPLALKAAKDLADLSPPPPPEYRPALEEYGKALTDLASGFGAWVEGAQQRVESKLREQQVVQAGEVWSRTDNPNKADPAAWRYDTFLHCAVPQLDKLQGGQEILEFLVGRCVAMRGQKIDTEFLLKLQKTCIPEAQTAPAKAPATFKATLNKFAPDSDRLMQAFGVCFRKMNKVIKQDDLEAIDKAWERSQNAGTQIRTLVGAGTGAPERP